MNPNLSNKRRFLKVRWRWDESEVKVRWRWGEGEGEAEVKVRWRWGYGKVKVRYGEVKVRWRWGGGEVNVGWRWGEGEVKVKWRWGEGEGKVRGRWVTRRWVILSSTLHKALSTRHFWQGTFYKSPQVPRVSPFLRDHKSTSTRVYDSMSPRFSTRLSLYESQESQESHDTNEAHSHDSWSPKVLSTRLSSGPACPEALYKAPALQGSQRGWLWASSIGPLALRLSMRSPAPRLSTRLACSQAL